MWALVPYAGQLKIRNCHIVIVKDLAKRTCRSAVCFKKILDKNVSFHKNKHASVIDGANALGIQKYSVVDLDPHGSGTFIPDTDPDPAKSERSYK